MLMPSREATIRALEAVEALSVDLPDGLVGFPAWRHFQLKAAPDDLPVLIMSSFDEQGLSFLAIDPSMVIGDYYDAIPSSEILALGMTHPGEALVLVFLIVEQEPLRVMANLLGPVVINPQNGAGRQLVLAESGFTTRHPIESFG